jgi:hypothetical protein
MADCEHRWDMTDKRFGFVVFEKCYHCSGIRTFFSTEEAPVLWDKYREGDCFWNRVEVAQSFQYNLKCVKCGLVEKFDDLMGLLFCTSCMEDCEVERLQKKYEKEKTWVVVAFGHFPEITRNPIPPRKLDILTDYFNQRRDTTRSRIKVLSFDLVKDLPRCKGVFVHDVGMLSENPPEERKPVF